MVCVVATIGTHYSYPLMLSQQGDNTTRPLHFVRVGVLYIFIYRYVDLSAAWNTSALHLLHALL